MAEIIAFPPQQKRRHTILIVDDQPAIRELLSDVLNESGFHALTVESGDEAARMLARGIVIIDLVFGDSEMPGILNGFALAQWVSQNKPGLPVLLACDGDEAEAVGDLPGVEILARPYDIAGAVRRIGEVLRRNTRRRA